jgi:hypothetical protein
MQAVVLPVRVFLQAAVVSACTSRVFVWMSFQDALSRRANRKIHVSLLPGQSCESTR